MSQSDIKKWSILKNVGKDITDNIKSLHIFGTNADQYIIITNDDTVYSFGSNSNGCLGLGHTTAVEIPNKIVELFGEQLECIEFGSSYDYVLTLTKKGTVYSWGNNNCGQLGNGNQISQFKPISITSLLNKNVIDVKCGHSYSLALTKSGDLFSWGSNNSFGKMPFADTDQIVSIACGLYHAIALTSSGKVYCWSHINSINWLQVPNPPNVLSRKISCGPQHSLILASDGSIYCFDQNTDIEYYSGRRRHQTRVNPKKINISEKFTDIGAVKYYNISVGLTDSGVCYVWGEIDGCVISTPFRVNFNNIDDVLDFYSKNKTSFKQIDFVFNDKLINFSLITHRISNGFNNKEFSDVAFKFDDKHIYAYKSYLIMVCDHFKSMFTDNKWKESKENEIEIKDYSYDVYYAFLKYLYTDTVDINSKDLVNLLDLANCYFEEELKKRCVKLLKNYVTIDNYSDIYASAVKYNSLELKEYCNCFFVNNINKSVTEKLLDKYAEAINAKFT